MAKNWSCEYYEISMVTFFASQWTWVKTFAHEKYICSREWPLAGINVINKEINAVPLYAPRQSSENNFLWFEHFKMCSTCLNDSFTSLNNNYTSNTISILHSIGGNYTTVASRCRWKQTLVKTAPWAIGFGSLGNRWKRLNKLSRMFCTVTTPVAWLKKARVCER